MYTSTLKKKWVQNVLYVCNDMNSSLFNLLPCRFFVCPFFALFFHLFVNVSFVSTTLDKFQRHCRISLSQINVVNTIRLKFKLYAFFIEWDGRINFLFVRAQDIINSWDFPSKISRNCPKKMVPKFTWNHQWEMFVKMSPRDQLVCLADFVGMNLLPLLFLLSLPNCFPRVVFPHSLQLSWSFFYL